MNIFYDINKLIKLVLFYFYNWSRIDTNIIKQIFYSFTEIQTTYNDTIFINIITN